MRTKYTALSLAIALFASYPALAVEWGKAPLGCLPDRVVPWTKASEMEPCHCPPPGDGADIPDVQMNKVVYTVLTNVNMGSGDTLTATAEQLKLAESDTLKPELYMPALDEFFKTSAPGVADFIGHRDRTTAYDTKGNLIFTLDIKVGGGGFEGVTGKHMPMPAELAMRCYPSVCDAGEVPVMNPAPVVDIWDAGFINPDGDLMGVLTVSQKATCNDQKTTVSLMREGCIQKGTPITLVNGDVKPIEELKLGDKVKSAKGEASIIAMNRFIQHKDTMYGINGGKAFVSVEHPILTTKGWKSFDPHMTSVHSNMGTVGQLVIGDSIVTSKGTLKVESIDKHEMTGETAAYNLAVDGDGTFIANDVVVKSLKSVQIHY